MSDLIGDAAAARVQAAVDRLLPYLHEPDRSNYRSLWRQSLEAYFRSAGFKEDVEIGHSVDSVDRCLDHWLECAGISPRQTVFALIWVAKMPGGKERWVAVSEALPEEWCDPVEWRLRDV